MRTTSSTAWRKALYWQVRTASLTRRSILHTRVVNHKHPFTSSPKVSAVGCYFCRKKAVFHGPARWTRASRNNLLSPPAAGKSRNGLDTTCRPLVHLVLLFGTNPVSRMVGCNQARAFKNHMSGCLPLPGSKQAAAATVAGIGGFLQMWGAWYATYPPACTQQCMAELSCSTYAQTWQPPVVFGLCLAWVQATG